MREIIIGKNEAGQRFDKYLKKYLDKAPASFIYKMLRKKNITLNNVKADGSEKLNLGDHVKLFLSDETVEKFSGKTVVSGDIIGMSDIRYDISKDIIYEDEHVLFINKPAGILSQKAKPEDVSINEYMIDYLLKNKSISKEQLSTFKPSICNRLDRNTTGLITCGKTLPGTQALSLMFKDRTMSKYYIAVVRGLVSNEAKISGYLKKDEKLNMVKVLKTVDDDSLYDEIETEYKPLLSGELDKHKYTVLKVKLITGKTHQIRAHLSSIGHPIIGDSKYGRAEENRFWKAAAGVKHQLLHSYEMVFPETEGELAYLSEKSFKASVPAIYKRINTNID